jgi:trehalose 6-phosphate phosphatase
VAALTAAALAERLRPLTSDPSRGAVMCDIDGTLAPIVDHPNDARVPEAVSRLLGALVGRYACVACVSGRSAVDARRVVGQASLVYVGLHGAEVLRPGAERPELNAEMARWERPIRRFTAARDAAELGRLGIRIEDKGAITAFHSRGAPDADVAEAALRRVAAEARAAGLATQAGRKVLEVRPPVAADKGLAARALVAAARPRAALFGGDDTTDLDAFDALDGLVAAGELEAAVRVGVRSDEGPPAIVERADIVVDGVAGFARVLEALLSK